MRLVRRANYANITATLALALALGMTPAGAHVTDEFSHLWGEHIKPKLATSGTINQSSNPVHWTKLKGVPAGFADGADAGLTGLEIASVDRTVTPGSGDYYSSAFVDVPCPAGKKAISGGWYVGSSASTVTVHADQPNAQGTGWRVNVYNGNAYNVSMTAYAVCVR